MKKGWIGYTDDYIREKCKEYIAKGFTAFKIKVGRDIDSDIRRCKILREEIGWTNRLVKFYIPKFRFVPFASNDIIASDGGRKSNLGRK